MRESTNDTPSNAISTPASAPNRFDRNSRRAMRATTMIVRHPKIAGKTRQPYALDKPLPNKSGTPRDQPLPERRMHDEHVAAVVLVPVAQQLLRFDRVVGLVEDLLVREAERPEPGESAEDGQSRDDQPAHPRTRVAPRHEGRRDRTVDRRFVVGLDAAPDIADIAGVGERGGRHERDATCAAPGRR